MADEWKMENKLDKDVAKEGRIERCVVISAWIIADKWDEGLMTDPLVD